MSLSESFERNDNAAKDHRQLAREFLRLSREFLAEGNLHQASEKGWGAASPMAKAVAEAKGWEYSRHSHFNNAINEARRLTGNERLPGLRGVANDLHTYFYERKINLDAEAIEVDLQNVEELLDILEPLSE